MPKRIFDLYCNEAWGESRNREVDAVIDWYNAPGSQNLTVNFWIDADTESALTVATWVIMRLRMQKNRQLNDPQFCILPACTLSESSLDLISGLDIRLPQLRFMPRARALGDFAEPFAFIEHAGAEARRHMLNVFGLFLCEEPDQQLPLLIEAFDNADPESPVPCVEVPFEAPVADAAALCDAISALWHAEPGLTGTLDAVRGGFVKRFYQLKELWHLSLLEDAALTPDQIGEALGPAPAQGGVQAGGHGCGDVIAAFDAAFLARHASAANYAGWRPRKAASVLAFDLDSIADSHECQSPVFINGQWLVDRATLSHAEADVSLHAGAEPTAAGQEE